MHFRELFMRSIYCNDSMRCKFHESANVELRADDWEPAANS